MGSYPTFDPTIFSKPITQATLRRAVRRGGRRAAVQPRDRRPVSDGLDVQADHRARGADRAASITPDDADRRPRLHQDRHDRRALQRRQGAATGRSTCASALQVSSDVYFYLLGQRPERARRASRCRSWARELGLGQRDRHRPARRVRRHRSPTAPGASASTSARRSAARSSKVSRPAASPTCAPGPRATTSTSRSARATCRPRRCRWPSPTRRSPTAAASPRPHLGLEVEDAGGRAAPAHRARRRAQRQDRRRRTARRSWTACTRRRASRRHLGRRLRRLARSDRYPVYGKTGTAAAHRPARRPVLVRRLRPRRRSAARSSSRRPSRSGGFGAEAAAPVARLDPRRSGSTSDASSSAGESQHASDAPSSTPIRDVADAPRRAARARRRWLLPFDPCCCSRVLGLAACSLVDDRRRDDRRHPRRRRATTSTARPSTSSSALVLAVVLSRARLLAAARAEVRRLRPACIALDPRRPRRSARVARGSRRAIELPFFSSRPPSSARSCWSSRWRPSWSTARARLRERDTTARHRCCWRSSRPRS